MTVAVNVKRIEVKVHHSHVLYSVVVETEKATWPASFATYGELDAFILGVRAGYSMAGGFDVDVRWFAADGTPIHPSRDG